MGDVSGMGLKNQRNGLEKLLRVRMPEEIHDSASEEGQAMSDEDTSSGAESSPRLNDAI
eukprot:NODE_6332_length_516_cov_155.323340_g5561_i0.p3 GENE.NODE_6332_length_516_cov_155.323340_g5561_i0~~NODE_6332_length_516_cov_155.323340_g5561_i0.p3  ORF type:complete len:67 (+),score=25.24 NODE_6332_length_516_cov_155.323340_g5561_i0:26-202(+)